jgi:hypothetical protein
MEEAVWNMGVAPTSVAPAPEAVDEDTWEAARQRLRYLLHPTGTTGRPVVHHQHHAILVPYRNRSLHRTLYLQHMMPYLQRNYGNRTTWDSHSTRNNVPSNHSSNTAATPTQHTFSFWMVEQDNEDLFYKSWLVNVGLAEVAKATLPGLTCVIMNDVDLIPAVDGVPYHVCQPLPIQLSSELQAFNYSIPYNSSFGGVISLHHAHWQRVNGLGLGYHGWGAEDDDLFDRVQTCQLAQANQPARPSPGLGRFDKLDRSAEHHVARRVHWNSARNSVLLWAKWADDRCFTGDGLSSTRYQLTDYQVDDTVGPYPVIRIKVTLPPRQLQRLEYVPVLQTVDDEFALIKAAAAQNVTWGACHFIYHVHNIPPDSLGCPNPPDWDGHFELPIVGTRWDHVPPWHLAPGVYVSPPGPYQSSRTFAVVRYPYDRILARYLENPNVNQTRSPVWDKTAQLHMNFRIRYWLQHPVGPKNKDRLSPQHEHVYWRVPTKNATTTTVQRVDHILRHESLPEDFAALMQSYNLPIVLAPPVAATDVRTLLQHPGNSTTIVAEEEPPQRQLTIADFDPKVVALIQEVYRLDFVLFNYSTEILVSP